MWKQLHNKMQPEILESPCLLYQVKTTTFDPFNNSLSTTSKDSITTHEVSSFPLSFTINNNHNFHYPIEEDTLQLLTFQDHLSMLFDDFDQILNTHHQFLNFNFSSSSIIQKPLTLPQEGFEIGNKISLPHMLEAYGEALFQGQKGLIQVILRCLRQKVLSPIGDPLERLSFYLSQNMTKNYYLTQEAYKNFEEVFRALYQGVPHGKVAHFAANSSILESIPHDCEVVHIIDFDMGEGVQWPPMIDAIANLNKGLKLTSIKWDEENSEYVSSKWKFEETRRKLYEFATLCGLKLKVEEKGMDEIVNEIKKMNKNGGKREFLAFNCMVGLPHMGRVRSERHVMKFLNLINCVENRGIVTFGDGITCEKLRNCLEFRSFFEGNLVHYKALLESIESHFPIRFLEARISMECLFVAPNISSLAWLQKWEEMRDGSILEAQIGLKGFRLNKAILMEVKEMLSGCDDGSYQVRIEGKNDNELILQWKGTQLVKFSTRGN